MADTTFDIHKVYVRTGLTFVEYMGGPNFLDGSKQCPRCVQWMKQEPLNVTYITVPGGKVLVGTMGTNGRMILSKQDPDYLWVCQYCKHAISGVISTPRVAGDKMMPNEDKTIII